MLWIETGAESPNGSKRISPSPIEFVSLIQNADYVFMDSFHACCFSSLFERSFYVIRRNYQGYLAQHIRIEELLTTVEKYKIANNKLSELRRISAHFLEIALKNI